MRFVYSHSINSVGLMKLFAVGTGQCPLLIFNMDAIGFSIVENLVNSALEIGEALVKLLNLPEESCHPNNVILHILLPLYHNSNNFYWLARTNIDLDGKNA